MNLTKRELSEKMGFVRRDWVLRNGLRAATGLAVVTLVTAGIVFSRVPPQVPLFYSRPWGEAQVVDKQGLLVFTAGVWAAVLAGLSVSLWLYERDRTLSRLVVWCLVTELFLAWLAVITVWLRVGY